MPTHRPPWRDPNAVKARVIQTRDVSMVDPSGRVGRAVARVLVRGTWARPGWPVRAAVPSLPPAALLQGSLKLCFESGMFSRRLCFPEENTLPDPARKKQEGPVFFAERAGHAGEKGEGEETVDKSGKFRSVAASAGPGGDPWPPPAADGQRSLSVGVGQKLVQRNAALGSFPKGNTQVAPSPFGIP